MIYKYKSLGNSIHKNINDQITPLGIVLDIIENNQIWLPTMESLNDPFEAAFKEGLSVQSATSEEERFKIFQEMFDLKNNYSVISFTNRADNLLLWSHYADSFRGVAIELMDEPFLDTDVRYANVLYENSSSSISEVADKFDLLSRKSYHWKYEEEVRAIVLRNNRRHLKLKGQAIRSVALGHRADPSVALILIESCRKLKIPVRIISGMKDDFTFLTIESQNLEKHFQRMLGLQKLIDG